MKKTTITLSMFFWAIMLSGQTHGLHFYLQQAVENSPLINKNTNTNKLLKLNKQQMEAILKKPLVSVEAGFLFAPIISHDNQSGKFQWVSEGADNYWGYDLATTDGGRYQAYFKVEQPLFKGSVLKAYSQKNTVSRQLNNNKTALTKHEIEQLVNYQYILCLRAKQQSTISNRLVNDMEEQLKILKKLVEHGIYKQTDLMILQIETENYKLEYQNFYTQYLNNLADLYLVCGMNEPLPAAIKDTSFVIRPDTIQNSFFLKKYELDSINISANRLMFEQKYKPQVSLFATAGMNSVYLPAINRFGFSTGINFTWNIFDGNQKQIRHNKSLVELQTLQFEKSNFIKTNQINKRKYLNRINAVNKKIQIVENQLLEYKKLWKLYSYELSQAQVSIMDFKNLIRDIAAKQQENLELHMEKQIVINSYNYWNY